MVRILFNLIRIIKIIAAAIVLMIVGVFTYFDGAYIVRPEKAKNIPEEYRLPSVEAKPKYAGTHIYFINLDRSTARLDSIKPLLEQTGLPYTRIAAVEGAQMSDEMLANLVDIEQFRRLTGKNVGKSVIGCTLSHVKAWRAFLESDAEFAIIMEDDLVFNPQALSQLSRILPKYQQRNEVRIWDICTLFKLNPQEDIGIVKIPELQQTLSMYFQNTFGVASMYMLTRQAATQLIQSAFPVVLPIDMYIDRGWELGLVVTDLTPGIDNKLFGDSEVEKDGRGDFIQSPYYSLGRRVCRLKSRVMYSCAAYAQYLRYQWRNWAHSHEGCDLNEIHDLNNRIDLVDNYD